MNRFLDFDLRLSIFGALSITLILISVIFPTGQLVGIPIKNMIVLLLFISGIALAPNIKIGRPIYITSIAFIVFLSIYILIGILNNYEIASVASNTIFILSTVLLAVLPSILINIGYLDQRKILKLITIASIIFATLKIIAESLILIGQLSAFDMQAIIYSVFGYYYITLEIGNLARIFLPNDFISPLAIYVLISQNSLKVNFGPFLRVYGIIIFMLSMFLTYSRYFWIFALIAIVMGIYNELDILRKSKVKFYLVCTFMLISVFVIGTLNTEIVGSYIGERYNGQAAESSDLERDLMAEPLAVQFNGSPIFGNGLGSYSRQYIRFEDYPWLYELQWLSILGQLGVVGTMFLIMSLIFPIARKIWQIKIATNRIGLIILFIFWLSTGIFNCFLLTSSAGVVYSQFILVSTIFLMNYSGNSAASKSHRSLIARNTENR